MKINAVIENKDGGTLVLDFPRSIYDVYEKIQSVGITRRSASSESTSTSLRWMTPRMKEKTSRKEWECSYEVR